MLKQSIIYWSQCNIGVVNMCYSNTCEYTTLRTLIVHRLSPIIDKWLWYCFGWNKLPDCFPPLTFEMDTFFQRALARSSSGAHTVSRYLLYNFLLIRTQNMKPKSKSLCAPKSCSAHGFMNWKRNFSTPSKSIQCLQNCHEVCSM